MNQLKKPSPKKAEARLAAINNLSGKIAALKLSVGHDLDKIRENKEYQNLRRDLGIVWNRCPECASDNTSCHNYNSIWNDGNLVCDDCGTFVRIWDAG